MIGLTVFCKSGGELTKRISLLPDGTIKSDGSACVMAQGSAHRIEISGVLELAVLIEQLTPNQALALGRLRPDLPDHVEVTVKRKLNGAPSNVIARTADAIVYDKEQAALVLFDFDTKGMPSAVAARLQQMGGFWAALKNVLPVLKSVAQLLRPSTSAGLYRVDTGEKFPGSGGLHGYVVAKDGVDSERFLRALHNRCWLNGLGWMMLGAGGQLLERSIVDRMVGAPERLVFEGGPVLIPPLAQDQESRRPQASDGALLDTAAVCPPLSLLESTRLEEIKEKARRQLKPQAERAREAFVTRETAKLRARTGMSEPAARRVIVKRCNGVLWPDVVLEFDDPELDGLTVGDVLAEPRRFAGETLADPLEGVDYGRCKAMVLLWDDGTPWIRSFAHGLTNYRLVRDSANIRAAMEQADKTEAVAVFVRLAVDADLDAIELDELRQLAHERSGVGRQIIGRQLKAAQQARTAANAKAAQARAAANRQDPRPQIATPGVDNPWLPPMHVINDVVGVTASPQPRDLEGDVTRIRKFPVPDMHAFISSEANAESSDD